MAAICLVPCKALGHGCHALERGCDKSCHVCCNLSCCPKDRPSPLFLCYTLLVNLPIAGVAIVAAISSFTSEEDDNDDCDLFLPPGAWLLVSAAIAIFFIAFAIRIYVRFSRKAPAPDIETGQHRSARHEFKDRAVYTICNDPLTFAFFFVFPFSIVWAILGFSAADDLDGCEVSGWAVFAMAAASLLYLVFSLFVGLTSCCWELTRLRKAHDQHAAAPAGVASTAPAKPSAGKVMQHMFAPGFGHHHSVHDPEGVAAAAPPYVQAPPTAQIVSPPTAQIGKPGAYPQVAPPGGTGGASASQPPAAAAHDDGVFDKMKHAFHK